MVTIGPAPAEMVPDDDQRIRVLERDLGRLEGVVESLITSIRMENELAQKARSEARQELVEMGARMERAVEGLAEEIKKLVRESAKQEAQLTAHRSQQDGVIGASRWLVATAIAVAALAASWFGSRTGTGEMEKMLIEHNSRMDELEEHYVESLGRQKPAAKPPALAPERRLP